MAKASAAILKMLRQELADNNRPENISDYQRFFKEKLKHPTGLKVPVLRKISNQCFRETKDLRAGDTLDICDDLLSSGVRYMKFFAFDWAEKIKKEFRKQDFRRFEGWLKKYVDGWGSCDHLCCGALGNLIHQYPDLAVKTRPWRKSKSQWLRRGAAVCLIYPVRRRILLDEVFKAADELLMDTEDLVQKGYGWMLKEAANEFEDEVFAYVMDHKDRMPRTALRYAIEKMPANRKKQAMKRET